MELTPTIVNVAVFGVILISAIFAYARGLTRESVTLLVWLGAGLAALKFYPKAVPFILDFKDLGEWTKWAAVAVTFVAALVVLTILGSFFARVIANSPLRSIDKGLGFLFGAARGILILAVVWIGYQQLVEPEYTSESIEASKGGQLVKDSAEYLTRWIPTEMPPFLVNAYTDFIGPDAENPETGPVLAPDTAPAPVPELQPATNG